MLLLTESNFRLLDTKEKEWLLWISSSYIFAYQTEKVRHMNLELLIYDLFPTIFFNELCWGMAMVAFTMPQQRKKEEGEQLRGESDQIKFIDLGFERWHVIR